MDKSLKQYIENTRSSDPTPGGGSVSALGGSLASSLVMMVSSLSQTKKIYKETLDEETKKVYDENLQKLTKLSDRLFELTQIDCDAYDVVANAYKIPKDDPERGTEIQKGLKYAADVPFETCNCILESTKLLYFYMDKTIKGAITDLGTACAFFQASFYGAALNVKINLESIKDEEYVNEKLEALNKIENEMYTLEGKIYGIVKESMKY